MPKAHSGKVVWFGAAPAPPKPKPLLLRWVPFWRRYKPFGLPVKTIGACSKASPEFVALVQTMVDGVSPGITRVLNQYGVAVMPGQCIWDASLWISYAGPRGHGDRFKYPAITGMCFKDGHLLFISEFREENRYLVRADNRQGVFNHEMGHCFDAALKYISRSPEFRAAMAQDVAKLDPLSKRIYEYLLQEGDAGASELFAECFACTQGLCCVTSWTKDMPEYFSASYQFVKDLVGRIEAEQNLEKDHDR